MKTEPTSEELFKKYGKAWRYVKLLEEELEARQSRDILLRVSLMINVLLLLLIFIW